MRLSLTTTAAAAMRTSVWVLSGAFGFVAGLASAADRDTTQALRDKIDALEARIQRLESQPEQRSTRSSTQGQPGQSTEQSIKQTAEQALEQAVPGSERLTDDPEVGNAEPEVRIGGALRYNVVHQTASDASKSKYGQSGLDVFRLNVDGEIDRIIVSAEYRFYSYMHTLKHGWLGYAFDDDSQMQFGIQQVPFGLLPYAAHNAWFGVPYYLGLADNYDMGAKYLRESGPWRLALAFYKNEELNDPVNPDRYAFDLIQSGEQQNEQINKTNARLAYAFGPDSACETELGASIQVAQVYNALTDRRGDHWAAAAHIDSRCGRWNVQLQGLRYQYNPDNPAGVDDSTVQLGAFGGTYDVASDADVWVTNLAYNLNSPWPAIEQIICYNDYSHMRKADAAALDSKINTLGCAIGSGPLFIYIDYIHANNMAYFGNGSLAGGGEDKWHGRLNINIGFYW